MLKLNEMKQSNQIKGEEDQADTLNKKLEDLKLCENIYGDASTNHITWAFNITNEISQLKKNEINQIYDIKNNILC
jgi:hypothetical protein